MSSINNPTLVVIVVISVLIGFGFFRQQVTAAARAVRPRFNGNFGSTWKKAQNLHQESSLWLAGLVVTIGGLLVAYDLRLFSFAAAFFFMVLAVDGLLRNMVKGDRKATWGKPAFFAGVCLFWAIAGVNLMHGKLNLFSQVSYLLSGPSYQYKGTATGGYYTFPPHTKLVFEWQRGHCVRAYPSVAMTVDATRNEMLKHKILFWSLAGTVHAMVKDLGPGETWHPTPGDSSNDYTCPYLTPAQ